MADPHNHTHQQRRHTRWTALAATALIATTLTIVSATPAAAIPRMADAPATWKACLGPATSASDFSDISMDSDHYDNINCLAYYGISVGYPDGTFRGTNNVTRSQMALFLNRAANVADVDLGDVMDQGFTDLDGRAKERIDAINRLAAKGIMPGRTAGTFDPDAHVTRAEMAHHLFTFLDLALDSVIIDRLPDDVEGPDSDGKYDGTGHIELNAMNGQGQPVDDYFQDVRDTKPRHIDDIVGAIYELGVTNGTNSQIGADGTFEPDANVTRAQMASFIMRTLAHTNLRPAGVTAQQTADETLVSVRDADFKPVEDAWVEVISSNYPDDAFDASGECTRWVDIADEDSGSYDTCQIDSGDEQTDADGNAVFPVGEGLGNQITIDCKADPSPADTYTLMTGSRSDDTDYTVWAWTGNIDDEIDDDTALAEVESANVATSRKEATQAILSGGNPDVVKMGETLTYTIQLADEDGNPVGPSPAENYTFHVTIEMKREVVAADEDPQDGVIQAGDGTTAPFTEGAFTLGTKPETPDSSGLITIPITYSDPRQHGPSHNDRDVRVQVTVQNAQGNTLTLKNDGTVVAVFSDSAVFSDNPSIPSNLSAELGSKWHLLGSGSNRNTVTVTVTDQYGDPIRGRNTNRDYEITINPASTVDDDDVVIRHLRNANTLALRYTKGNGTGDDHAGPTGEVINVTGSMPVYQDDDNDPVTPEVRAADGTNPLGAATSDDAAAVTVTVYWAGSGAADEGDDQFVLLADARRNEIIIDTSDAPTADTAPSARIPMAYSYGEDDKFVVEGEVVTMAQFEEIISSEQVNVMGATLSWQDYNSNRRNDDATWRLEGLTCTEA